ncbi:unnamed protein product [Miscanthus lutarioriparius]|uniref:Wall-associated receptor kinase galacturonan-binding domain-containing protein n=1 Tax=Miscanthus lutarioriparius TaxID=422564 RepID=A0A811SKE1_9POAL|nr:unnamed protein product [Miscanthus lutarioriparius]
MRRLLFLLLLLLSLSYETSSAAAAGGGSCSDRRCGNTSVPYPFGFSGDCPILLDCNATSSTPLLLTNSTTDAPYPITSFNSRDSTFVVSVEPSCRRTVREAQASLTGACYGVSSHTGLFLRGDRCRMPVASSCSVRDDVLSSLFPAAQCGAGGGRGNDSASTCVASRPPAPNSTAAATAEEDGRFLFLQWKRVDDAGCEDVTSAVYAYTPPEGVASVEFGVAELGWWLDGRCNSTSANANATVVRCAQNATCHDVETPSGAWGHRCACVDGLSGDGFAAGDGCHFGVGEFFLIIICCSDPVGVSQSDGRIHACHRGSRVGGVLVSGAWRATSAGPGSLPCGQSRAS